MPLKPASGSSSSASWSTTRKPASAGSGHGRARELRLERRLGILERAAPDLEARALGIVAAARVGPPAHAHHVLEAALDGRVRDARAHREVGDVEIVDRVGRVLQVEREHLLRRLGGDRDEPQVEDDLRILEGPARAERERHAAKEPLHHCPRMPIVGRKGIPATFAVSRYR
jgi:hypothetical protein